MVGRTPVGSSSSIDDTLSSLSTEEISKISSHMKDPKFMELLADYAKEIADPKARAEQELYLRQLEQEGRSEEAYGKGTQLVAPDPSFVAKTANQQSGQKIFINVCTSDKIAVATSKRNQGADGSKKLGLQWSVPLLLGKCKEGEDRNRIQCMVFDFVIHPDTCRMAMNNARYKILILDSAADNIEKATGWTLTRQYSYPKLAFKATEGHVSPQVMTVKQDPQGGLAPTPGWSKNSQQRSNGQISSNQAVQNSQLVVSEVATSSNSHANQSASKASGFRFPSRKSQPQAGAEPEQDRRQRSSLLDVSNLGSTGLTTGVRGRSNDNSAASNSSDGPDHLMKAVSAARSSKPGSSSSSSTADADSMMTAVATTRMQSVDLSGGSDSAAGSGSGSNGAQPEYELVYRGQVDLGDAWEGPGRNNVAAKHPKELVVRVKLPGLKQASQAQLNVTPQHLTVSVPGKHHLQLNLPYAVAETEGSASFNPAKQQLEVTLPVVPPKAPAMTSAQPTPEQQGQTDAVAGPSDNDQSERHTEGKQQPTRTVTPASTSDAADGSTSTAQQSSGLAQAARTADGSTTAADDSRQAAEPQDTASAAGSGSQAPGMEQPLLTENQRRWLELHQPSADSAAVDQDQAAAPSAKSQATEGLADMGAVQEAAAAGQEFIASSKFAQQVPGYVFAKRDAGLGYHKDLTASCHDKPQQQSASVDDGQQQDQQPATRYLLRPRLLSTAAADELD